MGIDIITMKKCGVKERIPEKELLQHIKNRNRAMAVFTMLVKNGKSNQEALETQFTYSFETLEGKEEKVLKVIDLLVETNFLEELSAQCKDCPVSRDKAFGCIGYISYPISHQCEVWLASFATEANKKGLPYATTLLFIKDQQVTGDKITRMRQQGQVFFESSKPVEIVLKKSFLKKESITTDQLLDTTFLQGVMQTTHINYLLLMYGCVSGSLTPPSDRYSRYDPESKKYLYLDLHLPNDADKSMVEFYNYFQHLFFALMNAQDVWME